VRLPFYQELRSKYPDKLVPVKLSYAKAVTRELVEENLSVSQ
jgi:hypothetical protein